MLTALAAVALPRATHVDAVMERFRTWVRLPPPPLFAEWAPLADVLAVSSSLCCLMGPYVGRRGLLIGATARVYFW